MKSAGSLPTGSWRAFHNTGLGSPARRGRTPHVTTRNGHADALGGLWDGGGLACLLDLAASFGRPPGRPAGAPARQPGSQLLHRSRSATAPRTRRRPTKQQGGGLVLWS
jgi:hypothetical protein